MKFIFFAVLSLCSQFAYGDFFRIPVAFSESDIPYADIEIQGSFYPLEIDLGSCYDLSLRRDILKNLDKEFLSKMNFLDVKGDVNKVRSYLISDVKIGKLTFDNVPVNEETVETKNGGMLSGREIDSEEDIKTAGVIGRPLLTQDNLFLDFSHSALYLSDGLGDLKKMGYSMKKMAKVSFDNSDGQIVLKVNTDLGKKRFLLDTGSTITFIKSSQIAKRSSKRDKYGFPVFTTADFILGDYNFGNRELHIYNLQSIGDCDGILGMDFLKEHAVYLDFSTDTAYICS